MLSETFAKASESHQKSLQHLKHSLEATEQAKEIDSSRASQPDASIGANTISRLEANLVLEREKYAADMSLLRKINDDIQAQLNKAVHNYNTLASSTRSEDDWLALAAEKRAHECASKLQFATESLEISAKKYGIVSEEYDTLNKETRTLRESCARLKSVISAKDAIIDDMYAKHATLVTENSDLQARTKSASATATNKKNLLQDYKTKLDALVAKISPLQELASQAQALRDTNRRLKVEGKIKEERVAEMRKRYEELDAFLKESAKVKETLDTDLEGKAAREVSRLRQKLATRECRLAALERAVRKCAGLLVARYRGLKGARVADEKVERLAREFFGVGVVGIVAGTINTIESLEGGIDAVLEGSDIEGGLVQLLRDALDRVPIGIQI
ncbi:hypothetical protein BC830DRAFT_1234687 [Chytriomyces sp. MP71]|nr:hypothetical protein BC830DRAFT_1234687 [Chytriomyces sp. MP71]